MRKVMVAAIQMKCCHEENIVGRALADKAAIERTVQDNIENADRLVREAAGKGAKIILLPELFEMPYFCQEKNYDYYGLAAETDKNKAVAHFGRLAGELNVVMPISFYERDGNTFYNTVAVIDADGRLLGTYRKTHIPDDHFYQEKFYFTPGDTGFCVWDTAYGRIGAGICWDQWFPECARAMALMGAEILFYPTAIGSEPILECDSMMHWRRCMQGHAGSNLMPVVAANRVGTERVEPSEKNAYQQSALTFYGSSFITDATGAIAASAGRDEEAVITAEFDLDDTAELRRSWGVFRDRRPEMYRNI